MDLLLNFGLREQLVVHVHVVALGIFFQLQNNRQNDSTIKHS